jgi:HD-GYP domain-containing protein (c-di-GMP phosphodiesterase class II)
MTAYDYFEALKNAAKSMVRVRSPRHLMKMITRFIDREVGLKHTTIIAFDNQYNRYHIIDSKGNKRVPASLIRLDSDNPMIKWFTERQNKKLNVPRDFLTLRQIHELMSDKELLHKELTLKERLIKLKQNMDIFKAAVVVAGRYKGQMVGLLLLGEKLNGEDFNMEELSFFQTLATDASMTIKRSEFEEDLKRKYAELEEKYKEISELHRKERQVFKQVIMSFAQGIYEKDKYTFGHMAEVESLGIRTAEAYGLKMDERERDNLLASLRLHDMGKMFVPDEILKKPAKLTAEEFEIMKLHVTRGAAILERIDEFKEVGKIIRAHHENFNGTGYPDKLKGEEIPIEARIISVVDAFHAMVSKRHYSNGVPLEDAIEELRRHAGTQFDPKVVEAFIRSLENPQQAANVRYFRRESHSSLKKAV